MVDISNIATGEQLFTLWKGCRHIPGGTLFFSKLMGKLAPYTSTIDCRVIDIEPGYAQVRLRDRRAVRNHLDCVHAIALMNLAEVATGLAIMSGLPPNGRGIIKGFEIDYLAKARGTLTAECRTELPTSSKRQDFDLTAVIQNTQGKTVAKATAHWLIGPQRKKQVLT